ncbi:MAG: tetratricopeptide repeat protein [Alphaproteobacteria bacterium]|nr:tetratricopeptide repeat protein [Alphaproteobacteria bacterium]
MEHDEQGLALSTTSAAAATAYRKAVRHVLEYRLDAPTHMAAALEADPDFVMGHCLKGLMMLGAQSTRVLDDVRPALDAAEARLNGATDRERANVAALRALYEGDKRKASAIYEALLTEDPTDLFALRQVTHALFWTGRSNDLRDYVAAVLGGWDEKTPGYGNVLGMYAFGLEESGEYAAAEANGKRAFEISNDDLWALHAVAHVMEMQGRLDDGVEWLTRPQDMWDDRNPFKGHLWWHLSLFHLERGEYDRVLAFYDDSVRTDDSDFYITIQNAASLLMRLEFLGVDVGERWAALADTCESRVGDLGLAFTTAHDMIALAMDGRTEAAGRLMESLRNYAQQPPENTTASVMAPVAIPLCDAIGAYGRGDYAMAADLLTPLRADFVRTGASHAQRDLFSQLLIESTIRAGRTKQARALLSSRVRAKPHGVGGWAKYADALGELGDDVGAEAALEHAAHYSVQAD